MLIILRKFIQVVAFEIEGKLSSLYFFSTTRLKPENAQVVGSRSTQF